MDYMPVVLQAVPGNNYDVFAYMNDGAVRCVNIRHLIRTGTVFEPLQDYNIFRNSLTVIGGTVAWDLEGKRDPYKCLDIDPISIYESPKVGEPL